MLELSDMTSPLRAAIAGAICTHAQQSTVELRARLARDLALQPFEDRTHDEMIDMAHAYGLSPDLVVGLAAKHEARFEPVVARHLCRACNDERVVPVEINGVQRHARCPECNTPVTLAKFDEKEPTL